MIYLNSIAIIVWAQLEVSFINVAPIDQFLFPKTIAFSISS